MHNIVSVQNLCFLGYFCLIETIRQLQLTTTTQNPAVTFTLNQVLIKIGPEKDDVIEGGEEWFEKLYGLLAN